MVFINESHTMIKSIKTDKAPRAIGPYSQAVAFEQLIFCSGQLGMDPKTSEMKEGIENQTKQVLANLSAVLEAAGSSLSEVIKTTVYLAHMSDFPTMNAIYEKAFGSHKPARATVEVANLPKNALVEIDAIAIMK